VTMTVNGVEHTRDVEARMLLVHFVRDELRLTGTHWGCDTSNCGTCVVLMDDEPVKSCTVLAATATGHAIRTVEGLERDGRLDLERVLDVLAARPVNELHVEAGARLNGALLQTGRVDELLLYVAPTLLGAGRDMAALGPLESLAQGLAFDFHDATKVGTDLRILARTRQA